MLIFLCLMFLFLQTGNVPVYAQGVRDNFRSQASTGDFGTDNDWFNKKTVTRKELEFEREQKQYEARKSSNPLTSELVQPPAGNETSAETEGSSLYKSIKESRNYLNQQKKGQKVRPKTIIIDKETKEFRYADGSDQATPSPTPPPPTTPPPTNLAPTTPPPTTLPPVGTNR